MTGKMMAHCRWMIRADLPRVLAIDAAGFGPDAWDEEAFLCCMRKHDCVAVVAEAEGRVAGYCVYRLKKRSLELVRMAVLPGRRRHGIGAAMMARLAGKLAEHKRTSLEALVPERMLEAQLFLRSCGLRWEQTVADDGTGPEGDCYLMRLRLEGEA